MPNPKRKFSKARTSKRRSQWKLEAQSVSTCSHCGQPKLPHRLCPNCGFYGGKEIIPTPSA